MVSFTLKKQFTAEDSAARMETRLSVQFLFDVVFEFCFPPRPLRPPAVNNELGHA